MHGFSKRLNELGLQLKKEEMEKLYERFLDLSDRKKEVYDDDLFALVSDELGKKYATYTLDYFNIISGNMAVPTATVRLEIKGERKEEASTGDGPVDAVFRAIDRITGVQTILKEYIVHAITPGKQAMGEVSVSLEINGKMTNGHGSSTDILEASAQAYVNALNRFIALNPDFQERAHEEK
jgi:2-isopropylmalate synthase